mmetsp:Transcript_40892/g.47539  ORF Transcript_40892/g.47539 Transcript_40892/m.47539 type:complete len:233 (+) Transcript_40892:438-1136(+)
MRISDQFSNSISSSNLHFHIHLSGLDVQSASEDTWEGERVVDLVREVRSASSNDVSASSESFIRHDFRNRVCKSKHNWLLSHSLNHVFSKHSRSRDTNEHINSLNDLLQRSLAAFSVRDLSKVVLLFVHVLLSALVNGALSIADNNRLNSNMNQHLSDGNTGSTASIDQDFDFIRLALCESERVEHTSDTDNSSSVLIIVENWNWKHFLQSGFDLKALWSLDIFQIDSREHW